MSKKNSKSVKSETSEKSNAKIKAGRPISKVVFPQGKFTLKDVMESNPHVCKLTIIKKMDADMFYNHKETGKVNRSKRKPNSQLIQLDETRPSESGKGRPSNVFQLREQKSTKKSKITAPSVDMTPAPEVAPESIPAPVDAAINTEVAPEVAPAIADPVTA